VYGDRADVATGRNSLEIAEPLPRGLGPAYGGEDRARPAGDEPEDGADLQHARKHGQVLRRDLLGLLGIHFNLIAQYEAIPGKQVNGILASVSSIGSGVEKI
jgi:hypothetical protein